MEQTAVKEFVSTATLEETTSPEVFSDEDLKWFEEVAKKYEDASTDLTDSVLSDELEKLYAEWFKEETEEYFSAKEEDYDSPEFQAYLKSFA